MHSRFKLDPGTQTERIRRAVAQRQLVVVLRRGIGQVTADLVPVRIGHGGAIRAKPADVRQMVGRS